MTKGTGKKSRAYNYLSKNGTYKLRHDQIETSYIHGVKDENGKVVIRPLNKDEKKFLNKFYKETVHCNLSNDEIKDLNKKIKALKRQYKDQFKDTGKYPSEVIKLEKKVETLRKKMDLFYTNKEDVNKIYSEQNAANRCIFNKSKTEGLLSGLDMTQYDEMERDKLKESDYEDEEDGEDENY